MSRPEKQQESHNERFLAVVGADQIEASRLFEPAHDAVLREAEADHTNRLRGRQTGDVWQGLGGSLGSDALARGNTTKQGRYENLATDALTAAMRAGSKQGLELKDALIHEGATGRLSNVSASGQSLASLARVQDAEAAQKTAIANAEQQDRNAALMTLGSMGAMHGANTYFDGQDYAKQFGAPGGPGGGAYIKNQPWLWQKGYGRGLAGG